MRVSYLSIILSLSSLALAVPRDKHDHGNSGHDGAGADASTAASVTASDAAVPAATSAAPNAAALAAARHQVVIGINETALALNVISVQAGKTGNTGVAALVTVAEGGLTAVEDAVDNIRVAIANNATISLTDEKDIANGVLTIEGAIKNMTSAILVTDVILSNDIANATTSVHVLRAGGLAVLNVTNITLGDLGLPASAATS